jgi:hypothetical protein
MADLQQRVLETAEGRDAARQEADRLESELADARAWKDRERSEALAEREERRRAERHAQEVVEREVRASMDGWMEGGREEGRGREREGGNLFIFLLPDIFLMFGGQGTLPHTSGVYGTVTFHACTERTGRERGSRVQEGGQ